MEFGSNSEISKNQYGRRVVLIHHFSNLWIKVFHFQTLCAMQMLTLRNIHRTIDLLWSWGLLCCWSTNHKSYCGGMWTWRTPQQCWLGGRQVHLGHRLGVLASLLVNIALKLHSVPQPLTPQQWWLRGRQVHLGHRLPPRQHCVDVALRGKQVHLGFASEYLLSSLCNFNSRLGLDSGDLSEVRQVHIPPL